MNTAKFISIVFINIEMIILVFSTFWSFLSYDIINGDIMPKRLTIELVKRNPTLLTRFSHSFNGLLKHIWHSVLIP